jgi:hypothetical protein
MRAAARVSIWPLRLLLQSVPGDALRAWQGEPWNVEGAPGALLHAFRQQSREHGFSCDAGAPAEALGCVGRVFQSGEVRDGRSKRFPPPRVADHSGTICRRQRALRASSSAF